MTGLSVQLQTTTILAILLGSVRAAAWLVICPPFAGRQIPMPVKALLSVAIALAVTPSLVDQTPALEAGPLLVSAAQQVLVGGALGFVTAMFFAAVQAAGDMIDLFGGFSIGTTYDPLSGTATSVFGRFYHLLATTLLFATDGHQMVLRGFTTSYRSIPLDAGVSLEVLGEILISGLSELLLAALQIAGPLIAVLFCADVALGLLSRVAPALNAFSLGFPAKILLTILLAGIVIGLLPRAVDNLVDGSVDAVMRVVRA